MTGDQLETFDRRLRERAASHQEERRQVSRGLFGEPSGEANLVPDFGRLPFDEAVAAYDEWIEQRVRAWRGEGVLPPAQPPPSTALDLSPRDVQPQLPAQRGRIQPIHRLEDMDALMVDAFALNEFMPECITLPPQRLCGTVEEFAAPFETLLPAYREWIAHWTSHARRRRGRVESGNPLSRLALHLPWQSTYINGWQLVDEKHSNIEAALQDHTLLKRIVNAVAGERWGYGFVERYTEWGKDLHTEGHDALHLIRRLDLPPPQHLSVVTRGDAMIESAVLTTTGWALWIGEYLAQHARPTPGAASETAQHLRLSQLWDALRRLFRVVPLESWAQILGTPIPGLDRLVQGVSEMLSWLLMNTDLDAKMINWSVCRAHRMIEALESQSRERLGFSLRDTFARLLMGSVEAHLGVMPVPYAVLVATNVGFAPDWDAAEIRRRVNSDARQNVDARLVMLTRLGPSVKHNVSTLVSAAVHSLGLRPPDGLEWT